MAQYNRPQVTIDYSEYKELLRIKDVKKPSNSDNHIVNAPEVLLDYLTTIVKGGINKVKRLTLRIEGDGTKAIVLLNEKNWLKVKELQDIVKYFLEKDIRTQDIIGIRLGYVSGLQSPLDTDSRRFMCHSGDFYEVHIALKYIGDE